MNLLKKLKFASCTILTFTAFHCTSVEWKTLNGLSLSYPQDVKIDEQSNVTAIGLGSDNNLVSNDLSNDSDSWNPPVTIYSTTSQSQQIKTPQLFLDENGNKIAFWSCGSPQGTSVKTIYAARQNQGDSSWSYPISLDVTPSTEQLSIDVTSDAQGNLFACWRAYQKSSKQALIVATTLPANSATWSVPVVIQSFASDRSINTPKVTVLNGSAFAIWQGETLSLLQWVRYDFITNNWTAVSSLNLNNIFQKIRKPSILVDAESNILLAIPGQAPNSQNYVLHTAILNSKSNIWSAFSPLSDPSNDCSNVLMGIDSYGNVNAVWSESGKGVTLPTQNLKAAYFSNGKWSAEATLAPLANVVITFDLSINSDGQGIVVWASDQLPKLNQNALQYSTKKTGNAWLPAATFTSTGSLPSTALNNQATCALLFVNQENQSVSALAETIDSLN